MNETLRGLLVVVGSLAAGIFLLYLFAMFIGAGGEPKHKKMEADINTRYAMLNERRIEQLRSLPSPSWFDDPAERQAANQALQVLREQSAADHRAEMKEWEAQDRQKTTDEFNQMTGGCCSAIAVLGLAIFGGLIYVVVL